MYHTGKRTRDWRKLKIVHEQEFVVGGWTESRTTGRPFGALLRRLLRRRRAEVRRPHGQRLQPARARARDPSAEAAGNAAPPFTTRPRTNERPHWTKPSLVAQLKFTEWTDDGLLRHPIYLGMRDDVKPETVRRETEESGESEESTESEESDESERESGESRVEESASESRRAWARDRVRRKVRADRVAVGRRSSSRHRSARRDRARAGLGHAAAARGQTLEVTNLRKVFWPKLKITKGDLMRYYVRVAPFILPVVEDRPLIMKRFPNGVDGEPFYQHSAPDRCRPASRSRKFPATDVPSRLDRRRPHHAAVHDAARGDLAGSVVLARAVAALCRPVRDRSRSDARRDVRGGARRRALGARRAREAEGDRLPEDVRRQRPAHLHPAARQARRTRPARSSARSSRPSSPRSIRRSRP